MNKSSQQPPQHQNTQPGIESKMYPEPEFLPEHYKSAQKLAGKTALITGGDSGIGRAVACAFALEGADVVISYLDEDKDANDTQQFIEENTERKCYIFKGDLRSFSNCKSLVAEALKIYSKIDILVNNIAEQHPQDNFEEITCEQFENTFRTNVFSFFYMIKASFPHLKKGACIINTTSVTAYKGSDHLIDYSATKGAIVSLTRSLSQNLVGKGIRVNAVAPGPIWTPLIPATFEASEVAKFGSNVPMKRVGQPYEVAPAYVFLASEDSSFMTGQVLHPNGGVIVNG